jgi:hypothetical protein
LTIERIDFLRKTVALALSWAGEPGELSKAREETEPSSDTSWSIIQQQFTVDLLK